MSALEERLEGIGGRLEEGLKRYRVPGASLAILDGDDVVEAAAGVLNRSTGVEATPDSVFDIGSITKLFTTTLVMQLVDEGLVELDAPVRTYLPKFELADRAAARAITVRQLLTHTSGIDGDFFQQTGRGDDAVERYVLACSALPQLHPPGQLWSYCNSGFVIAGRIVEALRGSTWDAALRAHLLHPLGTEGMGTLPEEALRFRVAVGHVELQPGAEPIVAPGWPSPRASGPAGATPVAMARDLLTFARMHLGGGLCASGARVLSGASVDAMQEHQVRLPDGAQASAWGLGWMLFDWESGRAIGHDGGTIGQSSFLRVLPERGVAVALLTNGGNAPALYRSIFGDVLGRLGGVTLPPLPEATPGLELDLERYAGTYERLASRVEVAVENGKLVGHQTLLRPPIDGMPDPPAIVLEPIDERVFLMRMPPSGMKVTGVFQEFDERGHPQYALAGGRLHRRVS